MELLFVSSANSPNRRRDGETKNRETPPSFYSFLHPSFVYPPLLPHITSSAIEGSSRMSHVHKHSSSDLDWGGPRWSGVCALCFGFNSQFVSRRPAAAARQWADAGAAVPPEAQQPPRCIREWLTCTHIPTRATYISFMHIHGANWATCCLQAPPLLFFFFAFANVCHTFTDSLTHKCKVW